MSKNTKIEWCDHTFNPWEGCQKAGPGCDHCYAEARNARFAGGQAINFGPGAPRRRTSEANWRLPVKWNAEAERLGIRYRVFCASLADVFDNEVDPQWRADLFDLIAKTPNLDWLLLTKRIGNAKTMMADALHLQPEANRDGMIWPLPNVWIGATIVNQEEADRDIPKLLQVPAAKRFLSMEPLLGPVDLGRWIGDEDCHTCGARFFGDEIRIGWRDSDPAVAVDFETDPEDENDIRRLCPKCGQRDNCGEVGEIDEEKRGGGLHWVIVGGESGHNARPMHPDWARSLRDQCQAAGVPFLFKQHGEWIEVEGDYQLAPDDAEAEGYNPKTDCVITPDGLVFNNPDDLPDDVLGRWMHRAGKKAAGRLLDGRTWDEFPE